MSKKLPYVVSQVPPSKVEYFEPRAKNEKVYYCHIRDFPNIPVLGSIGSYKKAKAMCDLYNQRHTGRVTGNDELRTHKEASQKNDG